MFGDRLSKLREEKKLSQEELAKRLGIARTTYSGYENNAREPDQKTLDKIASFFDVSVDYLLCRTNDRKLVMSNASRTLVDSLELSDEEIMERIEFMVDGIPLTEEQIRSFLSYVRIVRAEGKKDT